MSALSKRDLLVLRHLQRAEEPLWGGHIQRGEPITDPAMQRWLELGLIEVVGQGTGYVGYALTDAGKSAISDDE